MRCGNDDAAIGMKLSREERHAGRRDDAGDERRAARAHDASGHSRFQHVPRQPRVLADNDALSEKRRSRLPQTVSDFARQLFVCNTAHSIRSEEPCHIEHILPT